MSPRPDQELVELVRERGKILRRSLSTVTTGKSVALTQAEENISLINNARNLPSPGSSSCHHIQDDEHTHNKATSCGYGCHSECSHNFLLLSSLRQNAVALVATLDSANHKKINAITKCLFSTFPSAEVQVSQGVCGKDCSSSTIKLTNSNDIAPLASFHISGPLGLTNQPEFHAAQPNTRSSYAHDAPPDQQSNSVSLRGVLVNDNFSNFTAKQKLDTETSLEPLQATFSEYSPRASVYSNNMNLKRNSCQTEDSESHCNDDNQSDNACGIAPPPGMKGMKRKRAAQVHKLSEKRRRDKINKRLRALQDLIPNCTKMDKASVLDEAIEYVKSLQLQLQIMSIFAASCAPPTQMMLPAYYPAIGSGIALRLGMRAGCSALQLFSSLFVGYGTRFKMPMDAPSMMSLRRSATIVTSQYC